MKNVTYLLVLVLSLFSQACSSSSSALGPRWEKLGTRTVNYSLDKDVIKVTRAEGKFTAIKFFIKKAPINMRRCIIHFSNGQKQEVGIQKNMAKGSETRVIDLKGGARSIREVTIWYDTKKRARKRAVIELWGRH